MKKALLNFSIVFLFFFIPFGCASLEVAKERPPKEAKEKPPKKAKERPHKVQTGLLISVGSFKGALYPMFPWPPPQASADSIIPSQFLSKSNDEAITLFDVEQKLRSALDSCGYFEKSYYAVPGGFALVTHLEQINPDGTSKGIQDRWSTKITPLRNFSLMEYLKALFTANPGYYRFIAFIVTPHPFSQVNKTVSRDDAICWSRGGLNCLPKEIGILKYSVEYKCTALIYEFEQPKYKEKAIMKLPSRLTGRTHLEKANIWNELEG